MLDHWVVAPTIEKSQSKPIELTKVVALTGHRGYLGSEVLRALIIKGANTLVTEQRLTALPAHSLRCGMLVHCAGRLRHKESDFVTRDNVVATRAVLRSLATESPVVFASSRWARAPDDELYGASKATAELLVRNSGFPYIILRMTVLAGPSGADCGASYLSRMIRDALYTGVVNVHRGTVVDLLDVREAGRVLAELACGTSVSPQLIVTSNRTVSATGGAIHLDSIVDVIKATVAEFTGTCPKVQLASFARSDSPAPTDGMSWRALRESLGVSEIPYATTIRDTVRTLAPAR